MAKHALVSIVICNHNQARLLPRLFRSLTGQTASAEGIEILLVDQGSTDNSEALARAALQAMPCTGWDVISAEPRYSPGAAYNAGLSRAMGDFALCITPDVIPTPAFLEHCLLALEDNPGLDGAYSSFVRSIDGVDQIHRLPRFDAGLLRRSNVFGPAVLMRTELFGADLHFCESCGYTDWDFWIRSAATGRHFARIATPLAFQIHAAQQNLSPRADGVAKARIVCNTPGFFDSGVLRWALGLLRQEPWADPFEYGVIPNADDVGNLWRRYVTGGLEIHRLDEDDGHLQTLLAGV